MQSAAQVLIDEIDSLIVLSNDIVTEYEESIEIPEELYERLLYFHNRVKYIYENVQKQDMVGFLRRFKIGHVSFSKAQIDPLEEDMKIARANLKVLKIELQNGLLFKFSDLIKQEIFNTHLEGAKYLLDANWKDAAAVIIGGVLEDYIRGLSIKHGLDIKDTRGKFLSIDPMNINLCQAEVYNLTKQMQITGWAVLRNKAAHAHYTEYSKKDVEEMYDYVLNFSV